MAVGIFGSVKLADSDFNDVDVLYAYSQDRQTLGDVALSPLFNNITNNEFRKLFGGDGVYKLRLPASVFNKLGFYCVLIKPKSFETTILDCSFVVTSDGNDVQISKKGIIIPSLQFQSTGSLIGYQVEYYNDSGVKIKNFHRIITSSDLVSISPSTTNNFSNSTTYNLDSNGTQLFLTLTPDEVSLISNVQGVDLGRAGQKIIISNTFFDPTMIEVEMVDHDIKTLSYALYGNSTRDLQNGIYSIFDEQGNLYRQYNLLTRKNTFTQANIDIKEQRTSINLNENFNNLSQGI